MFANTQFLTVCTTDCPSPNPNKIAPILDLGVDGGGKIGPRLLCKIYCCKIKNEAVGIEMFKADGLCHEKSAILHFI